MRLIKFLQSPAGTALRYALSLALLGVIAWRADWTGLAGLRSLDWRLALPAALLAGLAYPLQAWRWQILLRAQGLVFPAGAVHRIFWIGQFYNSFLPGGIAGDAVRFAWLWHEQPDAKAAAAAGLAADRLLGLGALCALAAIALGLHLARAGGGPELTALLGTSVATFLLLLAAGWSAARTRWWEPFTARLLGAERAAALHDAATALGGHRAALAAATFLSVAVWLVDFLSLWLLARAAGLAAGLMVVTVAASIAYLAAALPVSIGGHGVREGALVATLGLLGVRGDTAQLALTFWTVSVGWSLVGGVMHLLTPKLERNGA